MRVRQKILTLRCVAAMCLLSGAIILSAVRAAAQEDEIPRLGLIMTSRAAAFRVNPETSGVILTTVSANTRLYWVEGQESNGFLRVVGLRGPSGWVSADDVQVLRQPPTSSGLNAFLEQTKIVCPKTLADCSDIGCAKPNTPHALANEIKRRPPATNTAILISFSDVMGLQRQALQRVGQGHLLSPSQRALLLNLSTSSGAIGEGTVVRMSGFLGTGKPGPHPNSGESVNCNLSGSDNNDFHINITDSPDAPQFAGIVVEMIPQDRNLEWTIKKLQALQSKRRRVLVSGPLFYDSFHIINQDPKHPLEGQPKRFSLWEIHRIVSFYICNREDNNCDPTESSNWIPLGDFNP